GAAADELAVEILGGRERAHDVVAQLLVLQRALDVRFDVVRCVVDLVLRLGHAGSILSPRYRAPDTPALPMQTDALIGSPHPHRLRWVGRAQGAVAGGRRGRVPLSRAARV